MSDTEPPRALRVVYFGAPDYAVPTLKALAADERFAVELVVTRPDRAAGRGRQVASSPVKRAADALNLLVYQPESLRQAEAREPLERIRADLFVVAAFGLIFGHKTLAIPRLGCLNLHASILPRYRGANPIAAAIAEGETCTGVSLMVMESGLDTGPVVATVETTIEAKDTTESLTVRLGRLGADLAVAMIPAFARGEISPVPQAGEEATVTRPMVKEDGWIDWSRPAALIERQVRAMWPWPRAWTTLGDDLVQIHRGEVVSPPRSEAPGLVQRLAGEAIVHCGEGGLRLDLVQASGGKPIPGLAWFNGLRATDQARVGVIGEPPSRPPLVALVESDHD